MKSIIVNRYGGPEVLQIKNVDKPTPKDNEILIHIKATAITAASTFMREGKPYFGRLFIGLRKPKTQTPGTDLAGVIEAIGKNVTKFKIGDHIMAETGLNCGAYAEYICLSEDELIVHQPENVSPEEATGILDGGSTALAFFTDSVNNLVSSSRSVFLPSKITLAPAFDTFIAHCRPIPELAPVIKIVFPSKENGLIINFNNITYLTILCFYYGSSPG